jgi:hypothetical protein
MDAEKKILTETPNEADMKRSYSQSMCDERAKKNKKLTKRISELEQKK